MAGGAQQQNGLKGVGYFTADYFDRRAQAKYAKNNPDSALTVGNEPRFRSRYGDPNHPANTGGLISLISGGKISRPSKDIRGNVDDRKGRRRCRRGSSSSSSSSDDDKSRAEDKARRPGLTSSVKGSIVGPGGEDQGLIKGIKSRTMKTNILYLTIVNKPTDREIDTADTTFTPPSLPNYSTNVPSTTDTSNTGLGREGPDGRG